MKFNQSIRSLTLIALLLILTIGPTLALEVNTIAGHVSKETDDGFLPTVGFDLAGESLEDTKGNLYVVDKSKNAIFIIDQDGYKTTFAGTGIAGANDGARLQASFKKPHGIVQDSDGNFFISDTDNNIIRKIDTDGLVSTFAGSGKIGSNDGHGTEASFKTPMGLAIDEKNNLYLADQRNHLIRKISPEGEVTTLAGTAGKSGLVDGKESLFNYPESVAVDSLGAVYVADKVNQMIRKIDSDGVVSTYAGKVETEEVTEDKETKEDKEEAKDKEEKKEKDSKRSKSKLSLLKIQFNNPSDLSFDSEDNLYIVDSGSNSIIKISIEGYVETIAGAEAGFWDASLDSKKGSYFNNPYCISINKNNELLISDLNNRKIRKINLKNEAHSYKVDTVIGSGGSGFQDGEFYQATINSPISTAYDSEGNLYFTDLYNNFIRKLDTKGIVTTIAGTGTKGFTDGGATDSDKPALLNRPHSVVVNSFGEIYFTDRDNHAIRKIDGKGNIITISGSGKQGYLDGVASVAQFNYPTGLAIDAADNIYIADTNNHRIRKLSPDGVVSTVSGSKKGYSSGNINFARFDSPSYLTVDKLGNIYVSDQGNHKIRKVSSEGYVTTLAGIGKGYQDGHGRDAQFSEPSGIAITDSGLLYIADHGNNRIRTIDTITLDVKTLVGSGLAGYKDGDDNLVSFKGPSGLIFNSVGELIVSDTDNHRIRKVSTDIKSVANLSNANKKYFVTTIAGNHDYDLVDGSARFSSFRSPQGVVKDSLGNLFISDQSNHVIRKINSDGDVSVFAGTGIAGRVDADSLKAQFSSPSGIAIDADDNLYIADQANHVIRKITPDAYVTTIAGNGTKGDSDGSALEAQFKNPEALVLDSEGNLFITDRDNHRIKKLDPKGYVTTVTGGSSGFKDALAEFAQFKSPHGIAIDSEDNLYITDFGNNRIRKISTDGLVTTVAGSGAASFLDGEAKYAQFNGPSGIILDKENNIYVSDLYNNKIRKISTDGKVTTLAGLGGIGDIDGLARKATFDEPSGLFFDEASIIVSDSGNNVIRKIYKSSDFAKEVLGFASVSEEATTESESGASEANTRPVIKLVDVGFYSKNKKLSTFTIGTDLELEAFSFDLEDKDNISNSIVWQSSYQGLLGEGSSYNIKNLKLGTHHISVTATDSGNLSASGEADIRIIPYHESPKAPEPSTAETTPTGESSSVTNKTVLVKVTTDSNKIFRSNKPSRFNAAAFDLRDETPIEISSQIKWSSSIDGSLGSGAETKTKLSVGTHIITASIGEFSDSISIEVLGANTKKKNKKAIITPKPKSIEEIKLPEVNLESTPAPKEHEATKQDKAGSGSNSYGVKDVRIKLL